MDVYVRTKGRLIRGAAKLVTDAWLAHFTDDDGDRETARARYRDVITTSSNLFQAFKVWSATATMSQLLELDQMFTDNDTLDTTVFPFICALYEAQADHFLALLSNMPNIHAYGVTAQMIFWRKDKTFARMFTERLKKTELWRTQGTMCVYIIGQVVPNPDLN